MLLKAIAYIGDVFNNCFNIMNTIFNELSATGLVIGIIAIFLVCQHLIFPLFSSYRSDTVKSVKKNLDRKG